MKWTLYTAETKNITDSNLGIVEWLRIVYTKQQDRDTNSLSATNAVCH